MLHRSERRCFSEKAMTILRRAGREMIRIMRGVKLLDRRNSEELMNILSRLDKMAEASSIQWYGCILRKQDENVIGKKKTNQKRDDK